VSPRRRVSLEEEADRVCEYEGCEQSLDGYRATKKYCTDAHRVAACRARKRAQEAASAAEPGAAPGRVAVTAGDLPVTLRERFDLLPALCPDPRRCEYRHRHASGPWTCEFNHPRVAVKEVEAARYASAVKAPADNGRAPRLVREDADPWGEVA
jgi:hypothetical protein